MIYVSREAKSRQLRRKTIIIKKSFKGFIIIPISMFSKLLMATLLYIFILLVGMTK